VKGRHICTPTDDSDAVGLAEFTGPAANQDASWAFSGLMHSDAEHRLPGFCLGLDNILKIRSLGML